MQEFHFGENLRIVRHANGISQEVIAIGLNMSQSKYSRLERQHTVPNLELVEEIAKLLEIEATILLSGREVEDLIPNTGFEQRVKEILNTRAGVIFYFMLIIPFINSAYDTGDGFCVGLDTTDGVRKVVRLVTGLGAIILAYYWLKQMQKGKL